jgi:hypothetical protein
VLGSVFKLVRRRQGRLTGRHCLPTGRHEVAKWCYALRLHEAGVVKSSPARIIADGTDWRFLNELKRELKV